MDKILSSAGKAGILSELGEIRLLRVLAGYRHFSAHAKLIFHSGPNSLRQRRCDKWQLRGHLQSW
jgi:hypothetical protein